jgi:hypothetical protein
MAADLPDAPIDGDGLEALLKSAWCRVRDEEPRMGVYGVGTNSRFERALMFRLALQLDRLLGEMKDGWQDGWRSLTVDTELHLATDGYKLHHESDVEKPTTESPDLIVHVRGNNKFNLLVVEAKHQGDPSSSDKSKLRRLVTQRAYRHAFAVRLDLYGRLTVEEVLPGEETLDHCQSGSGCNALHSGRLLDAEKAGS